MVRSHTVKIGLVWIQPVPVVYLPRVDMEDTLPGVDYARYLGAVAAPFVVLVTSTTVRRYCRYIGRYGRVDGYGR